jgi:RNA polymerase primary sigma factor
MTTKMTQPRATALTADVFDLYLEGLRELPAPLARDAEIHAAEQIEAAERACLDRILASGVALPELATWAERFSKDEMDIVELAQLGRYDGRKGRALLAQRLERAAELEARRLRARTDATREKARIARDAAVQEIGLHRERLQAIIARVSAALERPDAPVVLGRPRAELRALGRKLSLARRELDHAKNHLAEANLRLVVMLAKPYRRAGVAFADLVQEGNLGLMRAIDKFDVRVGTRFSTYAAWWVRQSIAREVARHREMVRLPFGLVDKRRRAHRTAHTLAQTLGRTPDTTEVADELGLTEDQVRRSMEAAVHSFSLSSFVSDEGDRPWDEVLSDDSVVGADDAVIADEREDAARRVLAVLSPREQLILRRRFGFDGDDETTLREIGEELGLSRERVRQLESIALEKLRRALPDDAI